MEKVLGLDLGTNSIGFALNEIEEKDGITIFGLIKKIISNGDLRVD